MKVLLAEFIRKITNPISYLIVFVGLVGIVLVFTFSTSSKKDSIKASTMVASNISLPETVDFAGEKVPLEYFDVREALERELLINTYWHSQTLMLIKRSTRYLGTIEAILKKNNIPDDFKYLALAESGLINVSSPMGAVGFWQFIPATAKDYGLEINAEIDERYNYEKSTQAACKYLRESHDLYKNWTMAAASYNVGRKNLNQQIQRQYTNNYYDILVNDETSRYVFRILALKLILNDPEKYGLSLSKKDYYQPFPFTELTINYPVKDLAKFAFEKGTNYKMLKLLNPWLRDNVLTNKEGKVYQVKIPAPGFRDHAKELDKEEVETIVTKGEQLVQ
jgi:membrane-bound lytic murein transglycosylase D